VARDTVSTRGSVVGQAEGGSLCSPGRFRRKYDVVEEVRRDSRGVFLDRVLISARSPWFLDHAGGTFFFGLPGNPSSTMVRRDLCACALESSPVGESALFMPFAR